MPYCRRSKRHMSITSFSGYEVLEVLPRGGMSTVYKARQISLDRIVAIKALPPAMGAAPADVEKFMDEARITARLKHPNIVQVYDFGKSEAGVYYFVMEYISGYSVAAWIRRKKYLSEENTLLCALNIAAAMSYAWQTAGIVHCDIKPDNVIIDGDGTVKLADLGLAMSVKSIFGQARTPDSPIFGTPNYISPEQSRGDEHLDCRADIYSLGAMLYHCMTGTMPFEGMPPLEVMDRQITDQIADPQDVNPSISVWSACLIEKMMAKDRDYRQKDWADAIRDLTNARSEMMPEGILPPDIASTVKRSPLRELHLKEVYQPPPVVKNEKTVVRQYADRYAGNLAEIGKRLSAGLLRKIIISTAGLALLLTVAWSMLGVLKDVKVRTGTVYTPAGKTEDVQVFESDSQKTISEARKAQEERDRRAGQQYEEVTAWFNANPAALNEAVEKFRKLADEHGGTKSADLARQEAIKLERLLAETRTIMAKLNKNAEVLAAQKRFADAVLVYENYQGPFAKETAVERKKKARGLRAIQAEALETERQFAMLAEQQVMYAAEEIAVIVVDDGIPAVFWNMKDIVRDLPLVATRPEFKNLVELIKKSDGIDQKILDSFRAQKGQKINIAFLRGRQLLFIRDVQGNQVMAEEVWTKGQGTIIVRRTFMMKDLALAEKIKRLGDSDDPATALMRVLLAVQDGDYQQATAAATRTSPLISKHLVEAIALRSKNMGECSASQALSYVFRRAGIGSGYNIPSPESCLDLIRGNRAAVRQGPLLTKAVSQFRSRYGSTETARLYDVVLEALTNTETVARESAGATPASPTQRGEPASPIQRGESPPPPKPDESSPATRTSTSGYVAKLLEQNAGLREDQIAFQADDSGRIVSVEIVSARLRDIKALEGMPDIQQLTCAGMRHNVWMETPVIAPFSDLIPIKKMNLRELVLNHTKVKDISVLSQMPLSALNLAHTKVNNLQPLSGTSLKSLDVSFTPVRDVRPLSGLALVYLNISGTEVSDLSPVAGMPLKILVAGFSKISDLTPLRGMPLTSIVVRNTEVTDIAPLRGMPLEQVDLADTRVRDISVLRGTSLRELDLGNTKVKSLEALAQLPLEKLRLNGTGVRDLAPLANLPLKTLDLRNTGITDLAPIQNSSIEEIWVDDLINQQNADKIRAMNAVLQAMPKLKSINDRLLPKWQGMNER